MYVTIIVREKDAVNTKIGYMGEARVKRGRKSNVNKNILIKK